MRYAITLALLSTSLSGIAATSLNSNPDAITDNRITCPNINKLYKKSRGMEWSAHGGWLSHDKSFSDHIGKFLGAQWRGANVGNIYCIYQGSNKLTFLIKLQYNKLVFEPNGKVWGKNLKGYKNCLSNKPSQCRFLPMQQQNNGNVYDVARTLKSSGPSSGLGF